MWAWTIAGGNLAESCGRPVVISLIVLAAAAVPGLPQAQVSASPSEAVDDPSPAIFRIESARDGVVLASWNPASVRAAREGGEPLHVRDFPLTAALAVDLDLEPFSVTSERTRFVVGRKDGPDRPLDFDPSKLALFRGRVSGRPGSHALLALGPSLATGYVDLGGRRFVISSRGESGSRLEAGTLAVFEATAPAGMPPGVPFCGVEFDTVTAAVPDGAATVNGATTVSVGAQHLEMAVETDYEFFQLFNDLDAAALYLVALYAQVSDIFLRDVNTWVDLVYVRLWDDPDDLFNDVDPSPLGDFRDHWNENMDGVARDVAQLLSGRRDYPFGGQAWLSSLCGSNAYSVVGYAMGFFPDPSMPSPYHYDISVTAHELGHNAGTGHTQNNGIDTCHDPNTTPQRGTIMSYCGQTWSGGNANRDHRFHTIIQGNIESHVFSRSCVVDDCNLNGIEDADDIQQATSADVDGNGTPDECEDCNGNSVLDDEDISMGTSLDLNGNGIPDECEPDCDADNVPDDKQIADGLSLDAYGDGVPDECETDCDSSSTSDYTDIQLDMPLDVDRNALLDSCQDCDTDGTPDMVELAGADSLWIASGLTNSPIKKFHAVTGVLTATSAGGPRGVVFEGQDLIVRPDGHVLVSSAVDHAVKHFGPDGSTMPNLVTPQSGGLTYPTGLLLTPGGTLLVCSRDTNQVLSYDGMTGDPLGAFVDAEPNGPDAPFGLTLGPDGSLFVTSGTDEVWRYDQNGDFIGVFVTGDPGLDKPRGMVFKPDGNLLVASYGTDEVREYDGTTGAPLGKWAQVGTATRLTQTSPWGLRVGPNGNVFAIRTGEDYGSGAPTGDEHDHDDTGDVVGGLDTHGDDHDDTGGLHLTDAQIYEYDARNGNFLRAHVTGNDHELLFPTGFDFAPWSDIDCNYNQIQDDCDIASGFSADADSSGTPDECEIDCNGNATLDRLDIIPFGASRDCNANLTPDECDLASAASADCTLNGIPDECEPDCNRNGFADSCDIQAGTSRDCNGNAVPDECDAVVDFETDPGWTVGDPGDTASSAGVWVRVNPVGTSAQPEYDHTAGPGRDCYVTGQGSVGGSDGAADVDGGKTSLVSATIDLSGEADPHVGYWRWFSNDAGSNPGEDVFRVDVSDDDGSSWTNVETLGPSTPETSGGWFFHLFRVADFVTPTATVKLRFVAEDAGGGSIVEAAVDDLVILPFCCQTAASCDDALTCTLDTCAASGQCENEGLPGTCKIDNLCFSDGQLNPANDCEVCDPSDPSSWTPALPAEIVGVLVGAGPTVLSWAPQAGAVYDVAGGVVSALSTDGGVSGAACLQDDIGATTWEDMRPAPLPGHAFYYLVRSEKSCGTGTYGGASSGDPRQPVADCP